MFPVVLVMQHVVSDESSSLLLHSNTNDLFVYRDDWEPRTPEREVGACLVFNPIMVE